MSAILSLVERLPQEQSRMEAIELLREWLRLAEAGEIVEVAMIAVFRDHGVSTVFSSSENVNLLVSGASRIQYRLNRELDER